MAKASHNIHPSFLIFILILLFFTCSVYASDQNKRPFKKVYAFGDSYTDTGNTRSNSGPSGFMFVSNLPYGRTFFHRPTNRYSDGRLVIDFLAQALSLPFLQPYLDVVNGKPNKSTPSASVNFAVAGSTAIVHSFFSKNNMTLNITPQSISTQLAWFNKVLEGSGCRNYSSTPRECEAVFNDALIWVGEIGANDYAYSFGSSVPTKTIQKLAVNSLNVFLKALMNKGAKYVVVQGLPPTGCLTLSMYLAPSDDRGDGGCVGSANNQSYTHNTILKSKLDALRKQFPSAVIVYADYYNAYMRVVKNPRSYGFHELYKVCCGHSGGTYNFDYLNACGSPSSSSCANPSQYINWDGVHLTEAMNNAMANSFLNGTYSQPPFSYLLSKKQRSG
ncbi:GDSL-like Lipase/Acylhydrolase superfamily protein [Perilla frutescens var. hirtella]|uniref:GDSL-like Lipase/Acylhydrolase superfamily protein n=1 Tax=Perilla frutescens var. hirtella TaxID=608512 RepID=A0AAD4P970_PERFH|nr:GDSL-like Lipase/Acylhydrolase superfamily protein [Perilla frutescens var. hirtella]